MIKCVIIDDEPLALKLLASYAEKLGQLDILATFSNPLEALNFISNNKIDLIFMDIQMPELNGMKLARILPKTTSIVFTTAYPEYAVEGFEVRAIDYLVKPITLERFIKAVSNFENKAVKIQNTPLEYLFIKTEYRLQKVNLDDIFFLKGMGDYTLIETKQGKIMTLENMKSFEAKLASSQFMRVHKSYIVSIPRIEYIERNRIKIAKELIPIGASYLESFRERMS